uniref:Thioredoxin domain-containing protein n=2 Tax=Setaria italica TaxID=4555 RepID=A0A0Q3S9R6_SETIT
GLIVAGNLPSPSASAAAGGGGTRRRRWWGSPGPRRWRQTAVRGDTEQRVLAVALASGRPATVLEFYSPRCCLCASLQGSCGSWRSSCGDMQEQ